MEEYFPEVVAVLEKHKKNRAPLKRTGVLLRNTRPGQKGSPAGNVNREGKGEGCGDDAVGAEANGQGVKRSRDGGAGRSPTAPDARKESQNQMSSNECSPNQPEENEALIIAATKGDRQKVKKIIEDKKTELSLDMRDEDGYTALMLASVNGHTDTVRLLVDAKANVDTLVEVTDCFKPPGDQSTALILASEKGHTEIVGLLLAAQANVDTQKYNGDTALMAAVFNGHTDIVQLLIDADANADIQNIVGSTALTLALEFSHGRMHLVRLLVEDAKANVNIQSPDGKTALMRAVLSGNTTLVEYFLVFKAQVDIPDRNGRTPLMAAAAYGNILVVELLLSQGADLSLKDSRGYTARAVAEEAGNIEVVERLQSGERMDDPWSAEMKSEWDDLRSLIDSEAVVFWPLHFLRSLLKEGAKLPYRQKVSEAAKDLGVDCQPFFSPAADLGHPVGAPFKLVAISYPWLSKEHPDPDSFRLRSVLEQLDKHWWAQEGSPLPVFVFWDYLSLFQHPPNGRRTDDQDAKFKAGLSKMDLIYSSPHTHVIRSTTVPESFSNPTPYADRGWCWFESAVTAFKPPAQVLSDEAKKTESYLRIPATPLAFDKALDTKRFTNGKADADGVKALYKNFLHRSVQKLQVFADGSWAYSRQARRQMDSRAALQLAALVEYIATDPLLRDSMQPQLLDLRGSVFDDATLIGEDRFPDLEKSSELADSLQRLLCAFGKLRSITAVHFTAFAFSRKGDEESKKVYMTGLQRGLSGLFPADGPRPLDVNLHLLASAGLSEVMSRLLKDNTTVKVDAKESRPDTGVAGETAMLLASCNGHLSIVRLLLDANADTNIQSSDGKTALMAAASQGYRDIVQLLIDAQAKVDIQNEKGWTALILASDNGHTDIVRLLIDAKAKKGIKDHSPVKERFHGKTALMLASNNGHTDIVRVLIDAEENLGVQSFDGHTALMFASMGGHTDIVRLLVDAKANVEMQTYDSAGGVTALFFTSMGGHTDIVRLLVDTKANVDIEDKYQKKTALIWASEKGHTDVVKLLTDAKDKVALPSS
uniref:Uncharacterized protein n=1 Tax=Chromera velia CCMP2878 TaxID=1169474 RepID=A0A0G4I4Q6_9ALVE|eukprot:Cvel_10973.t1-p1 / transcript=Cvel_10973.t1 / gene=Cvel_10973 / organism=Chromera_velia_CCMP2878 / gene_product=Putative ankyrin repeat protein MM_0045, putative / transcript_product=Putative ankyrin repeat protein MM_0045, putative / location=Cvel_scaffold675:29763-34210(-) / protein_length=1046 / sequence_SO=supercontig / SO=protein_coding / is_pseudo=false